MKKVIVALDPGIGGKNATGWAVFRDAYLVGAGLLTSAEKSVEGRITGQLKEARAQMLCGLDQLVIEVPVIYPHSKQLAKPADIVHLSLLAGALMGALDAEVTIMIEPSQWKGQLPKNVIEERVMEALCENERRCLGQLPKTKRHNAVDAVGLGLHHTRRVTK